VNSLRQCCINVTIIHVSVNIAHHENLNNWYFGNIEFCRLRSREILPTVFQVRSQRSQRSQSIELIASMSDTSNIFIYLLILLSEDIQPDPGPISGVSFLNMCHRYLRDKVRNGHQIFD